MPTILCAIRWMQTRVGGLICGGMTQLVLAADTRMPLQTREEVAAAAIELGARDFGGPLSPAEKEVIRFASTVASKASHLRERILQGHDPLGDALCTNTNLGIRRSLGMFYTPVQIVQAMIRQVERSNPSRLVDAGCGSGRFAAQAVRLDANIAVIAVDADPVATLACRAVLRTLGAQRATVINADYGSVSLPTITGRTAFVGNPPYVRHHRLTIEEKRRAREMAVSLGLTISGLSGLQIHFFLKSFALSKKGDVGCFITSAEWLDVAYGCGLRTLMMDGMGLTEIQFFGRDTWTFEDAMTTAVITCFEVGTRHRAIRVSQWGDPQARQVNRKLLEEGTRWSPVVYGSGRSSTCKSSGLVRLGDVVRVSRGVATGSNAYFVMAKERACALGIERYTLPVLHRAHQVLRSGGCVSAVDTRAVLLDPAADTDLQCPENESLSAYILAGERMGVGTSYLASHRKPWWRVNSKAAPIVATYMTRQAPAFALNPDGLRILNVIHGLYPRITLSNEQLRGLVAYLNANRSSFRGLGRTYQGGLEKFEPSEMEALLVPHPGELAKYAVD